MCRRGLEEEEEEEGDEGWADAEGVCVRVCVGYWWGGEGRGWQGFPLSHKADGADVSGCSQSQRGQVYPAAVHTSRDSSPSRSPLRILLLTSSLPAPG